MNNEYLINIKKLCKIMKDKNYPIVFFEFNFNSQVYRAVLNINKTKKYYTYNIVFINNVDATLGCYGNANSLDVCPKDFISFFKAGEDYKMIYKELFSKINDKTQWDKVIRERLKEQFKSNVINFYLVMNNQIPNDIPTLTKEQKETYIRYLASKDSGVGKIYCETIVKNPDGKTRSDFNNELARAGYPKIFEYFANDKTISFRFSANKEDEHTLDEIMSMYSGKAYLR